MLAREYGCVLRLVQYNLSEPLDQDPYDYFVVAGPDGGEDGEA